jgi:hypothetical protein
MIQGDFFAISRFALAFNPAGEELPMDPNVTLPITLVRSPVLRPSDDRLLVGAKIFR